MNYTEFENCIMRLRASARLVESRIRIESLLEAVAKIGTNSSSLVARDRFVKRLEEVGAVKIIKEMIGVSDAPSKNLTSIGLLFEGAQTSIFGRSLRASIYNGRGGR